METAMRFCWGHRQMAPVGLFTPRGKYCWPCKLAKAEATRQRRKAAKRKYSREVGTARQIEKRRAKREHILFGPEEHY